MQTENPNKAVHICHLTVLNPARHSRIYEKEAISQAQAGYQVTVIGQGKGNPITGNPQLQFTGEFDRLSLQRWRVRSKIYAVARKLQADVYILHTPELLGVGKKLYKRFPDCKVIYDMHEDYALNIQFGGYYPILILKWLAKWVRKQEKKASVWLAGVWYAERCFQGILPIESKDSLILENKFIPPPDWQPGSMPANADIFRLVFTGTVSRNWGVIRCLEFALALHEYLPNHLTIIGQVHDTKLTQEIKEFVQQHNMQDRVTILMESTYVPHEKLLEAIAQSHAGLAFYELAPHLQGRIPTKFYEHLALHRPILFTDDPTWKALNTQWGIGHAVQFPLDAIQLKAIAAQLKKGWIQAKATPEVWSWEGEARKMLNFLTKTGGGTA